MWHGTYGYHYHTLYNLVLRAEQRWCRFSSNWESYDYIKFLGGYALLPQNQDLSWMFNAQTYWLSTHFVDDKKGKSNEETWVHPGYLLHAPGTHLVFSRRLHHNRRFLKVKIKVPSTWEGFIPLKEAMRYVFWFWAWTWWDPERAFFEPCQDTDQCAAEPWWKNDQSWVDRSKYQALSSNLKNWGPFLPSKQCSGNSASFWFLYKLKFKVGGESIWAPVPRDPVEQGYIPSAPGISAIEQDGGKIQPYTGDPHRGERPWSTYDILPTDLYEGILTDEALERITGGYTPGPPPPKRQRLGEERERRRKQRHRRPSKHQLRVLRRVLLRFMGGHSSDAPDATQN